MRKEARLTGDEDPWSREWEICMYVKTVLAHTPLSPICTLPVPTLNLQELYIYYILLLCTMCMCTHTSIQSFVTFHNHGTLTEHVCWCS